MQLIVNLYLDIILEHLRYFLGTFLSRMLDHSILTNSVNL